MFKKSFGAAMNYIISGGSIILKAKAMEHNISNINNIIRWDV